MNVAVEAWLDQPKPIEIATPIYQKTSTTLNFTVLQANRTALNLSNYVGKFVMHDVAEEVALFTAKNITLVTAASGICKVDLTATDLASAKEALGELCLYSGGNLTGAVTHRIQFNFRIVKALIQ